MVPPSLMFRLFPAGRQAQLRPNALSRSFQSKQTVNTASTKSGAPANSTTAKSPNSRAFEDAVANRVNAAKAQAAKKAKNPSEITARRPRKSIPTAVGSSDPNETSPVPPELPNPENDADPAAAVKPKAGRPRSYEPHEPRKEVRDCLRWGLGRACQGSKALADRRRMNIVSEDACDAVLDRLKPSLEKHMGCDILDISPGAGVWSEKLHNFLKPRTHILLEPDTVVYEPLLEPLLRAPNSKYRWVRKSGLVWGHLEGVLSKEYLPFQTEWKRDDPRVEEHNNTLLVVANLGYSPKVPYRGFSSLAQMVIYQFMGALKAHSLFQKYGLVRMLIWINDEESHNILPRMIADRNKAAIEASFALEKVEEVASGTEFTQLRSREHLLDLESGARVLEKMAVSGIDIPEGRESLLVQELRGGVVPNRRTSRLDGSSEKVVAAAEETETLRKSPNLKRILSNARNKARLAALCDMYEEIVEEAKTTRDLPESKAKDDKLVDLRKRFELWEEENGRNSAANALVVHNHCENRSALRREKPLLLWDRRDVEPIKLYPHEFYPSKTMSLLDFQPKSLLPILREDYPANYDILEYLLVSFFTMPAQSVKHGLIGLVPGAYEWIDENCPTLKDRNKGGNPDLGRLSVRMLSEEMLVDMVEAWKRWPWKPSKYEMLSRMGSATHDAAAFLDRDEVGQATTQ